MIILYSTLEIPYSNCVLERETFPKIIKFHLYILVAHFSFDCKEYLLYNRKYDIDAYGIRYQTNKNIDTTLNLNASLYTTGKKLISRTHQNCRGNSHL